MVDAEQAVVDAYVVTARLWDRVSGYEQPVGFVRMIIRQQIARAQRRSRRRAVAEQGTEGPSVLSHPALWAEAIDLLALIWRLPQRQRQVLGLHLLGLNSSEIAQELGMKPTAVRTHLQRARARLRSALGLWPVPEDARADEFLPAAARTGVPGEPGTGVPERDPLTEFLARCHEALREAYAADEQRKKRVRAGIIAGLSGEGQQDTRRSCR